MRGKEREQMNKVKLTLDQQKGRMGLLFVAPWVVGFLLLFAMPMIESLRYSISQLEMTPSGIQLDFIGLDNFRNAFLQHATFNRALTESVMDMFVNVPLIIFFSLFSATLLNQGFRGRGLARAIFFLPVILASGAMANIESGDIMQSVMSAANAEQETNFSILKGLELEKMLLQSGVNESIVMYLTDAVNRIYEIISMSGVQILIFLAGLQSIPPSLYEASKIEGATGYEAFWKITFPMLSPLILTNIIYSVIDAFSNNQMTVLIHDTAFGTFDFGLSSAMSWIYFLLISIILFIIAVMISRRVFYYD
jgi:ABC-type sugar transport system permease subunit